MKGILHKEFGKCVSRGFLLIVAACLSLTACTDDADSQSDREEGDLLQLIPFVRQTEEMSTRADVVPDDYVPFTNVYPIAEGEKPSFGIFLAEPGTTAPDKMGMITYQGLDVENKDVWRSYVEVKQKSYYVYGYLPAEAAEGGATLEPYNGDFANGAVMTIKDLPAAATYDVCVITGIQDATSANAEIDLHLGKFAYQGKPKGQNYIGVLLDHLYSEIDFQFKVDERYNRQRHIRLKKMTLKSVGRDKVTATVRIVGNNTDSDPIEHLAWTANGGTSDAVLFENEAGVLVTTNAESFGQLRGFAMPAASNSLLLECIYDVYDIEDNLVRRNCKAENDLSLRVADLKRGEMSEVTLTVRPTYLYVLSEPDMDNPTVVMN